MRTFGFFTKVVLLSIAILTVSFPAVSSEKKANEEKALKDLQQIMSETKAVGLAVAVVKDGKIIFLKSLGKKNLEDNIELGTKDIFRIASISKSFTATAIMQLKEQGKLKLDQDVSELIGFRVRNPKYPEIPITVKMLLSHSSSLCDSLGYFELDVVNPDKNPGYAKAYHYYAPGEKYDYCNLGFNILGTLVEKLSGERFDNYIHNHIIKPLGLYGNHNVDSLDASRFVTLYQDEAGVGKASPQPAAYRSRAAEIASGYIMGYSTPLFSPTGGVKISAEDLAKYMIMHMNYGKGSVRIISKKSSKLMQTPIIEASQWVGYGMALEQATNLISGETMVGHTGSAYGVYTAMFFNPEKKFGFVMMTNGCNPDYKDGWVVIDKEVINCLYRNFIKK